jgi:hypothetical protein
MFKENEITQRLHTIYPKELLPEHLGGEGAVYSRDVNVTFLPQDANFPVFAHDIDLHRKKYAFLNRKGDRDTSIIRHSYSSSSSSSSVAGSGRDGNVHNSGDSWNGDDVSDSSDLIRGNPPS